MLAMGLAGAAFGERGKSAFGVEDAVTDPPTCCHGAGSASASHAVRVHDPVSRDGGIDRIEDSNHLGCGWCLPILDWNALPSDIVIAEFFPEGAYRRWFGRRA